MIPTQTVKMPSMTKIQLLRERLVSELWARRRVSRI